MERSGTPLEAGNQGLQDRSADQTEAALTLLDLEAPPLPPMYCLARCGKLLWDPKSRELGYGPECAAKLGIITPHSPRFSRRDGGDCEGQGDLFEAHENGSSDRHA
ncbi:DUF6011 domain-containing protein [Nonomuraea phyllanthi]|uniref:DUF6011 domain-containing protein n=1 Tax=Nonomuraea phyllanthi TaxID=2219224 RepID=UPI001D01DD12